MEESPNAKEVIKPQVAIDNPRVAPYYLATGATRERLEKAWGKKFPTNAIFFKLLFRNYKLHGLSRALSAYEKEAEPSFFQKIGITAAKNKVRIPEFASYDDIKDWKDGQNVTITIEGTPYAFLCQQVEDDEDRKKWAPFEDCLAFTFQSFRNHANFFIEDAAELIENEIIKVIPTSYGAVSTHGPKGYPFMLDLDN